nr:MAG TPA: hypothetical protein [Microviridae sp.]
MFMRNVSYITARGRNLLPMVLPSSVDPTSSCYVY